MEGVLVAYTDGSYLPQKNRAVAMGIFFGFECPLNVSEVIVNSQLSGTMISSNRAELFAAIHAMGVALELFNGTESKVKEYLHTRPQFDPATITKVEIRSDSEYVCNGAKSVAWKLDRSNMPNRDLWIQFSEAQASILPRRVRFRWVRGHSADVGNQFSDFLARSATERYCAGKAVTTFL